MKEAELRNKIVNLLSDHFVVRRPVNPEELAKHLAPRVGLPLEVLTEKVATVAKGLGVRLIAR